MVGVPGRSRGCATCRQRKIKCDLTTPECGQCTRSRRTCTGALTGAFFVHASTPKSARQVSPPPARPSRSRSPLIETIAKRQKTLTIPASPTLTPIYTKSLVETFLSSFPESSNWPALLPPLLSHPPLAHTLLSTSLAFLSSRSANPSHIAAARQYYHRSLTLTRTSLTTIRTSTTPPAVSILIPLLHCYFELLSATSPLAWAHHLAAAATLIVSHGPGSSVVPPELWRAVRLGIVYVTLTTEESHIFANPEWCAHDAASRWDGLVGVWLAVPSVLAAARRGEGVSVLCNAQHLISRLEGVWQDGTSTGVDANRDELAMYHSAVLLLSALSGHPSPISGKSTLDAAEPAEGWTGTLAMVFPVKIVALWGSEEDRARAVNMLGRWRRDEGLGGICGQASPVVAGRAYEGGTLGAGGCGGGTTRGGKPWEGERLGERMEEGKKVGEWRRMAMTGRVENEDEEEEEGLKVIGEGGNAGNMQGRRRSGGRGNDMIIRDMVMEEGMVRGMGFLLTPGAVMAL